MKVTVHASRQYNIFIEKGVVATLPRFLKTHYPKAKVMIITDTEVEKYHGEKMRSLLRDFTVEQYTLPSGESSKSTKNLIYILEFLAEKSFRRNDVILAFGGGVVGDIAGLSAGLYLRGIDFIQIPTTFLATIDSSVGGKTAVNLYHGKNLMGMFYQPACVMIDRSFLETLPQDIFEDGVAEAIKYGMIRSEKLFEIFEREDISPYSQQLDEIIQQCVEIKRTVVAEDEFDNGIRQILNFGHTFGHAMEAVSGFKMSHGRGVACGMKRMTRYFAKESASRLESVLKKYHLMPEDSFSTEEILSVCRLDKKSRAETVTIIYCKKIGEAVLQTINFGQLEEIYERTKDASNC